MKREIVFRVILICCGLNPRNAASVHIINWVQEVYPQALVYDEPYEYEDRANYHGEPDRHKKRSFRNDQQEKPIHDRGSDTDPAGGHNFRDIKTRVGGSVTHVSDGGEGEKPGGGGGKGEEPGGGNGEGEGEKPGGGGDEGGKPGGSGGNAEEPGGGNGEGEGEKPGGGNGEGEKPGGGAGKGEKPAGGGGNAEKPGAGGDEGEKPAGGGGKGEKPGGGADEGETPGGGGGNGEEPGGGNGEGEKPGGGGGKGEKPAGSADEGETLGGGGDEGGKPGGGGGIGEEPGGGEGGGEGESEGEKPGGGNGDEGEKPAGGGGPELGFKLDILVIFVDDLGWNDVSFHGSEIPTPNIDALAMDGVILNNYYVEPLCTPSRAALMTGKMPSRTGMQKRVILAGSPTGLPLEEKIMPQYFKEKGYKTHLVGKWHLGNAKEEFWPTRRGYDSFFGHLLGANDYFEHRHFAPLGGMDLWEDELLVAPKYVGHHSTDIYKARVMNIYKKAKKEDPLFVMFSPQAVHSGNRFEPYQVLKSQEEKVNHIKNDTRRKFAALVSGLDDAVGEIVSVLKETGRLERTIIVFSTDNGALPLGTNNSIEVGGGSNWPLRGTKGTAWEGGIKGVGFVWNTQLKPHLSNQLSHLTDLLPTLYTGAGLGVIEKGAEDIDGRDIWNHLKDPEKETFERELFLVDDTLQIAYRMKNLKYIKGRAREGLEGWYNPPDEQELAAVNWDKKCVVDDVLKELRRTGVRKKDFVVKVECKQPLEEVVACSPDEVCLFDIEKDPCELENIASKQPDVVKEIDVKIKAFPAKPPVFSPKVDDCKPSAPGYAWWPCKLTSAPGDSPETPPSSAPGQP